MSAVLTQTDHNPRSPLPTGATGKPAPVFIIGVPRSGTTWLGKIFDSHPWVLYRHEPDAVLAPPGFPGFCPAAEIPRHTEAMRRYVVEMTGVRQVKTTGTRPIFAKPYQRLPAVLVRRGLGTGLRVAEAIPFAAPWAKRVPIPDLIAGDAARITCVVKSVSLIGAVGLLASAVPESRVIVVLRHPCGHVASVMRGAAAGQRGGLFGPRVLATARARELGMTRADYEALPVLDRWVWAWAFAHAKLFAEVGNLPNVRLLSYESLCAAPLDEAREAMAFAGLSWTQQTARFVAATTRGARRERYFSLFRDPMEAATKWRRELSPDQIAHIAGIVEEVLPGLLSGCETAA